MHTTNHHWRKLKYCQKEPQIKIHQNFKDKINNKDKSKININNGIIKNNNNLNNNNNNNLKNNNNDNNRQPTTLKQLGCNLIVIYLVYFKLDCPFKHNKIIASASLSLSL